ELLLGGIGRVVRAVVQPRVDVERNVDYAEADVGAVGPGAHYGLQEGEAGALAAGDADDGHAGRHAGKAEAVGRGRDDPGDVSAVPVVVVRGRVDAAWEPA